MSSLLSDPEESEAIIIIVVVFSCSVMSNYFVGHGLYFVGYGL